MIWQDEKYFAEQSIKILNEYFLNKIEKDGRYFKLFIRENGQLPCWKTVYLSNLLAGNKTSDGTFLINSTIDKIEYNKALTQGFESWEKVRIYLSGMRDLLSFQR